MSSATTEVPRLKLGLAANAVQFWLLVTVNAFVGSMVGIERDVLPLVGERVFGIASETALVSFVVTFGLTKALSNFYAGRWADRIGRKNLLIAGWIAAMPVPLLLMFAPSWGWIVAANVLLGVNQGLCWSMTVVMKIDLVGPKQRGMAMGLNEFAGYLAVGAAAYVSGAVAQTYGLRPWPFALGIVSVFAGLLLSRFAVRETHAHAHFEAQQTRSVLAPDRGTLAAINQAGFVNNLNDALVWAVLPLYFAAAGLEVGRIAVIASIYPVTWGLLQLVTGALSDRLGRKWMIATGMWLQSLAIVLFLPIGSYPLWIAAAVLLGAGTALVYPVLLAAVSDSIHPLARASAVGSYRLWRDLGYAAGAIVAGTIAQFFGRGPSIATIAVLTLLSGLFVAARMNETRTS